MNHTGISPNVARFLLGLVNGLTLHVGSPDFDRALTDVQAARAELSAIVSTEEPPPPAG